LDGLSNRQTALAVHYTAPDRTISPSSVPRSIWWAVSRTRLRRSASHRRQRRIGCYTRRRPRKMSTGRRLSCLKQPLGRAPD